MNVVRHFAKGFGTFCRDKAAGQVVTVEVVRVTCGECIRLIEERLEAWSVDPYADKVGQFCVCLVRVHGVEFKYMARLDAVDGAKLHFTAKDGSQKVFDRSAVLEVDARPFVGAAYHPHQTRVSDYGGHR